MKPGKTYAFGMGLYFTVDAILKRTAKDTTYRVSWWRTQDGTGKRVKFEMADEQDWTIPNDQKYREVE